MSKKPPLGGFPCPSCEEQRTDVVDSRRSVADPASIRRRRQCPACGLRFSTMERVARLDASDAYIAGDVIASSPRR